MNPTLSAGVVIFRTNGPAERTPHCLVLRAYRDWDFPKGRVEPGEAPLAAACREVQEETGLTELQFPWGEEFRETAPYGKGKVARYYLAQCTQAGGVYLPVSPELGRPEHDEFRWVDCETAALLLAPRLQPILSWACAKAAALQHGARF
jgi:bis(5'-nucleosidyl)-tetraphosphatase